MRERVSLRTVQAVVWRDGEERPDVGTIGVAPSDGAIVIALEHPDGSRMVALLGPKVLDVVASFMADAVEADIAAVLAAGADTGVTLQ